MKNAARSSSEACASDDTCSKYSSRGAPGVNSRSMSAGASESLRKACSPPWGTWRSYWFRWDSSPNRELIHQAIEAFEDHLAHGENSKKVNGRGKRRDKPTRRVPDKPIPEIDEKSSHFSIASPENDLASASSSEKADGVVVEVVVNVVGNDKDEDEEYEEVKEEDEVVGKTMLTATNNHNQNHKGLARKVLPDVLGLFNSRLWSLWSPNV